MAREGLRYQLFTKRAVLVGGAQALGFTILGGRLYYLSIVKGESYRLRADQNRIGLRLIVPERGEILDYRGVPLATNRRNYRVILVPDEAGDVDKVLHRIAGHINLGDQALARLQRQIRRQPSFWRVTVADQLEWDEFSRINAAMPELPGVQPNAGLSRYYPYGGLAGHVLGYLGQPPEELVNRTPLFREPGFQIGREGLEKVYDEDLRGLEGNRRVEVNAIGREVRELGKRQEATKGKDLRLAIDVRLQNYAATLMGEQSAAAVVIDLKTGDLRALASTPAFDPNEFTRGMSRENWQALLSDPRKPLLNKCISGQFPPGSTVKMMVALAALEKGIVKSTTEFSCRGHHTLGRQRFHCWKKGGHGRLDLTGAIRQSCDVYFYKIAEQIDVDDIANMANRLGLGLTHDISLDGQRSGLVPTKEWKRLYRNEAWQGGDTLNVAIGQGATLATPLQLAVMCARIATGRAVTPRLVLPEQDGPLAAAAPLARAQFFETLDVNPLHLDVVRTGMAQVVLPGGTAILRGRKRGDITQAGKTGTAQVRRISKDERATGVLDNEELPWQSRDHALYVGFAPVEAPRYAVSILVQHGGSGSRAAAPLGQKILDEAVRLDSVPDEVPAETSSQRVVAQRVERE